MSQPGIAPAIGRFLVLTGVLLTAVGLFLVSGGKLYRLGRLPGDLVLHTRSLRVYVPITTSLILSLALTLIFWVASIFRR